MAKIEFLKPDPEAEKYWEEWHRLMRLNLINEINKAFRIPKKENSDNGKDRDNKKEF